MTFLTDHIPQAPGKPKLHGDCCRRDKNPITLFLLEITNTILSSADIVFHIVYKHKTYSLVREWGGGPVPLCLSLSLCM